MPAEVVASPQSAPRAPADGAGREARRSRAPARPLHGMPQTGAVRG